MALPARRIRADSFTVRSKYAAFSDVEVGEPEPAFDALALHQAPMIGHAAPEKAAVAWDVYNHGTQSRP